MRQFREQIKVAILVSGDKHGSLLPFTPIYDLITQNRINHNKTEFSGRNVILTERTQLAVIGRNSAVKKIAGREITEVGEPESGKGPIIREFLNKARRGGEEFMKRPHQLRWVPETLPVALLAGCGNRMGFNVQVPELSQVFASPVAAGIGVAARGVDEEEVASSPAGPTGISIPGVLPLNGQQRA